jgi:hypothetical protein
VKEIQEKKEHYTWRTTRGWRQWLRWNRGWIGWWWRRDRAWRWGRRWRWVRTLLGINPLPTPIYGCNMAVLVASGISCIEVRWSTNGCNWNGAIAWGNRKMMCCNRVC